jgi:hypothetical protein
MKVILKLVFLFSFLVILFGFYQLKHEQDIFAQSKMRCCNNGLCKAANCIAPSSIEAGSLCDTYLLTCKDCIDLEYSSCIDNCSSRKNYYCNNDGTPYYGTKVPCLEQK